MAAKDIVLFIMVFVLMVCLTIQLIQDENKKQREKEEKKDKACQDLIKRENSDVNLDGEE